MTNVCKDYVAGFVEVSKEIGAPLPFKMLNLYGKDFNEPRRPIRHLSGGTPKQCYSNSYYLALDMGWTYCEGYALPKQIPIPIAHAWVLDNQGRIVDSTWKDGSDYFGIPFNTEDLVHMSEITGYAGGVFENLYLMHDGLTYQQLEDYLVQSIAKKETSYDSV